MKLSKYIVCYENDVTTPYDMKWYKVFKIQTFKLQAPCRHFHTPFREFKTQTFKLHTLCRYFHTLNLDFMSILEVKFNGTFDMCFGIT